MFWCLSSGPLFRSSCTERSFYPVQIKSSLLSASPPYHPWPELLLCISENTASHRLHPGATILVWRSSWPRASLSRAKAGAPKCPSVLGKTLGPKLPVCTGTDVWAPHSLLVRKSACLHDGSPGWFRWISLSLSHAHAHTHNLSLLHTHTHTLATRSDSQSLTPTAECRTAALG